MLHYPYFHILLCFRVKMGIIKVSGALIFQKSQKITWKFVSMGWFLHDNGLRHERVIGVLYLHVKIKKGIFSGGREMVETTQGNCWKGFQWKEWDKPAQNPLNPSSVSFAGEKIENICQTRFPTNYARNGFATKFCIRNGIWDFI